MTVSADKHPLALSGLLQIFSMYETAVGKAPTGCASKG